MPSRLLDDYETLLARFPPRRQGYGREPTFPGVKPQPMTYALVLMAEVARLTHQPTEDGQRRVRSAVAWLVRHSDLDADGLPGWGLPHAWDAFGDGRGAAGATNPAHFPYTITTAFAIAALADAWPVDLWTPAERRNIAGVVGAAIRRWCAHVFTKGHQGGFFWYSPFEGDAHFCPNVSAMMLGAVRVAAERFASGASWAADASIRERTDEAATAIVTNAQWHDDGPFWNYAEAVPRLRPNDAVHHAYVIWGMEAYRDGGGTVEIPWTTRQGVNTLSWFAADGVPVEFPAWLPVTNPARPTAPMRLWGAGMILAVLARYGSRDSTRAWLATVRDAYGVPRTVSLLPMTGGADVPFYHRHAAHLLFGLSQLAFVGQER